MIRTRKVGTLALGICLIIFGSLFLVKLFVPSISYQFLLSLWPLILIILGIEVILSYVFSKEEKYIYDGAGVFLMIILSFFAMGMAAFEFLSNNSSRFIHYIQ